jgi:hypothetical protein
MTYYEIPFVLERIEGDNMTCKIVYRFYLHDEIDIRRLNSLLQ